MGAPDIIFSVYNAFVCVVFSDFGVKNLYAATFEFPVSVAAAVQFARTGSQAMSLARKVQPFSSATRRTLQPPFTHNLKTPLIHPFWPPENNFFRRTRRRFVGQEACSVPTPRSNHSTVHPT
jgi:hypothetical protein